MKIHKTHALIKYVFICRPYSKANYNLEIDVSDVDQHKNTLYSSTLTLISHVLENQFNGK